MNALGAVEGVWVSVCCDKISPLHTQYLPGREYTSAHYAKHDDLHLFLCTSYLFIEHKIIASTVLAVPVFYLLIGQRDSS